MCCSRGRSCLPDEEADEEVFGQKTSKAAKEQLWRRQDIKPRAAVSGRCNAVK
jgi:hypothetical protein